MRNLVSIPLVNIPFSSMHLCRSGHAADHLAVYADNVESTAQIRHSRANIRWSRPESMSSLLNLLRNHAG